MSNTVILGAQWGDEGKGKIVDLLTAENEVIVRFGGGANAGHTIVVEGEKIITHLLPSGIQHAGKLNIVGPGVLVDLEVVAEELEIANRCDSEVLIDVNAPIVLPIHKVIDRGREKAKAKRGRSIGTTQRGIGPMTEDLYSRQAIRFGDLRDMNIVKTKLNDFYGEKLAIAKYYGQKGQSVKELLEWLEQFKGLGVLGADTRLVLKRGSFNGILFEGAQGVLLDIFHGDYPYVTSSPCTPSYISTTFGADVSHGKVIGVAKAYVTRVGEGLFPTELKDELGDYIREKGGEYGATTGRPRRCGWLDLKLLRHTCHVAGITRLALTKLDILSGLETIRVALDYRGVAEGEHLDSSKLRNPNVEYVDLPGWSEDISNCRSIGELPQNAQKYIEFIEHNTKTHVSYIGVGPDREQVIGKEENQILWYLE